MGFYRLSLLILVLFVTLHNEAKSRLKLATTTSTYDSGLLDVLLPPFHDKVAGTIIVDVIAVGTGKALKLAENGDVDVVLVHAPKLETAFVSAGFGTKRRSIMYNDFVIARSPEDQAEILGMKSATNAFSAISAKRAQWFSRGDLSGTHLKEIEIWKTSGITPEGTWYVEVGQGMAATLRMADEKKGYVLIDRGTYLALKETVNLEILVEGDTLLHNLYSIIAVNPKRWPHTKTREAQKLIDFLTSNQGQALISRYQKSGQRLFTPLGNTNTPSIGVEK